MGVTAVILVLCRLYKQELVTCL